MKKIITTESVEQSQRIEFWKNACREYIGAVEISDHAPVRFQSSIDESRVGLLKITHFSGDTQRLVRDQSNAKSSDTDDYAILIESGNRFVFDHNGRQHAGSGNMVFID
jgi:hypothetical protein